MSEDRLREAADVIADDARARAARWSRTIPGSITVSSDGKIARVVAHAKVARPAELRLRHPLFGNRRYWYGPPGSSFLGPAAEAKADYKVLLDQWEEEHPDEVSPKKKAAKAAPPKKQ